MFATKVKRGALVALAFIGLGSCADVRVLGPIVDPAPPRLAGGVPVSIREARDAALFAFDLPSFLPPGVTVTEVVRARYRNKDPRQHVGIKLSDDTVIELQPRDYHIQYDLGWVGSFPGIRAGTTYVNGNVAVTREKGTAPRPDGTRLPVLAAVRWQTSSNLEVTIVGDHPVSVLLQIARSIPV